MRGCRVLLPPRLRGVTHMGPLTSATGLPRDGGPAGSGSLAPVRFHSGAHGGRRRGRGRVRLPEAGRGGALTSGEFRNNVVPRAAGCVGQADSVQASLQLMIEAPTACNAESAEIWMSGDASRRCWAGSCAADGGRRERIRESRVGDPTYTEFQAARTGNAARRQHHRPVRSLERRPEWPARSTLVFLLAPAREAAKNPRREVWLLS